MKSRKRFKKQEGDLVKIELGGGWHAYGRVLPNPLFAFYDLRTKEDLSFDQIKDRAILFKIWVMDRAVISGRWKILRNYPLEQHLRAVPTFFKQDPINYQAFSIYRNGEDRPASRAECSGLERAAVWDPEHVEDRLRDYYAEKPNKWVESMKIR
jgi:hypothetical protein